MLLGISEKAVMDLAEDGQMPAYKVGGVYLRFKADQVEEFKKRFQPQTNENVSLQKSSQVDRLRDFIYFYDFYILAFLLIGAMLFIIAQGL